MIATLVLSLANDVKDLQGDIIGVDRGAFILASNNIEMELAIGDFDSVNEDEYLIINKFAHKIIKLSPNKDETDTLAAIEYCLTLGYNEFNLIGGIGKRIDHTIANLLLLVKYKIPIYLKDDLCIISVINTSIKITKKYKYVSVFAVEPSILSLSGFLYNLTDYDLKPFDIIGISNEIKNEEGAIDLKSGRLLIIQTNEKRDF